MPYHFCVIVKFERVKRVKPVEVIPTLAHINSQHSETRTNTRYFSPYSVVMRGEDRVEQQGKLLWVPVHAVSGLWTGMKCKRSGLREAHRVQETRANQS
eukprot:s164_g22.t1